MNRSLFSDHLPFFSSWPHSKIYAGSRKEPAVTVFPGIHEHRFEIGSVRHSLFISRRSQVEKFAFHVQPDSRTYLLNHLTVNKFLIEFVAEGERYELRSENGKRMMIRADGAVVALFETGWTDDDNRQKVKYWLHWNGQIPLINLVIFFCIALKFDPFPRMENDDFT